MDIYIPVHWSKESKSFMKNNPSCDTCHMESIANCLLTLFVKQKPKLVPSKTIVSFLPALYCWVCSLSLGWCPQNESIPTFFCSVFSPWDSPFKYSKRSHCERPVASVCLYAARVQRAVIGLKELLIYNWGCSPTINPESRHPLVDFFFKFV